MVQSMSERRVVSLVPSLTHLMYEFGLIKEVVGCTSFCVEPPGIFRHAKVLGGTKDPNIEALLSLSPTHILVNLEENRAQDLDILRRISGIKVVETFPKTVADVAAMIESVAEGLGEPALAAPFVTQLLMARKHLTNVRSNSKKSRSCLYLIWQNPYMAAGEDTFISSLLSEAGFNNVLSRSTRYPVLTPEDIITLSPEVIFFPSEPYPFRRRDVAKFRQETGGFIDLSACYKIDGRLLSWHGPMTSRALKEFAHWYENPDSTSMLKAVPTQHDA